MNDLIKNLYRMALPFFLAGTIAACGGQTKPSPTATLTPTPTRFVCVQPNVDFRNDTGAYILFEFTSNAAKEIGIDIKVNDVSPCNNIYYAFDFRWGYPGYGAMGLQQFGNQRQVNFSIFDVGIVGYNANGSECVHDSEGAISCRTPFNWREGVQYQYRVAYDGEQDGGNWWRTEVVDLDSGEKIDTGRILIPSVLGLLRFDTSIWVEEVYPSRCKNEPTTVVYSNTSFKTDEGYHSLEKANLIYRDDECPESDVDYVDGNFVIEYGPHVIRNTREGDLLR